MVKLQVCYLKEINNALLTVLLSQLNGRVYKTTYCRTLHIIDFRQMLFPLFFALDLPFSILYQVHFLPTVA